MIEFNLHLILTSYAVLVDLFSSHALVSLFVKWQWFDFSKEDEASECKEFL